MVATLSVCRRYGSERARGMSGGPAQIIYIPFVCLLQAAISCWLIMAIVLTSTFCHSSFDAQFPLRYPGEALTWVNLGGSTTFVQRPQALFDTRRGVATEPSQ
jgi:hypothetical protein